MIQRDSSESRKSATRAMSSGSAMKFSGVCAAIARLASSVVSHFSSISLSVAAGAMALTRMFCAA
nr:hypothetical protein [Streptomyces inhibens]